MTTSPTGLYDPTKSYAYNLEHGPFGDYAGGASYHNGGEPGYDFFGVPVYAPFGIAAGPLPAARFIEGAFRAGYDIVTFKSVRMRAYPCPSLPEVWPPADPAFALADVVVDSLAKVDWPMMQSLWRSLSG